MSDGIFLDEGFQLVKGPVWKDDCRHPVWSFTGTVQLTRAGDIREHGGIDKFDVYLYPRRGPGAEIPSWSRYDVCIRFGNDGPDYYSLGAANLFPQLALVSRAPAYLGALQLMIFRLGQTQEIRGVSIDRIGGARHNVTFPPEWQNQGCLVDFNQFEKKSDGTQ